VTEAEERPRHAVVLAAGIGTRLRPLTYARAKPAIPVAGVPLIRRTLGWLASHGVTDIVINLHYLPDTIAAAAGDGGDLGVRVRYSWEQPRILGSAGGVRQALSIIGASSFFIVNGDTICRLDLEALAAAHRRSGAGITMAVAPHPDPTRYGGMKVFGHLRATGFVPRGSIEPSMHVTGVQIANAQAFESIRSGSVANSVGGLYDELIRASPGSVGAFVTDAPFWDVGTQGDYWHTSIAFAHAESATSTLSGRNVSVSRSARVARSILWDDVEVMDNAVVAECIVTDGVRVPANGRFHRQTLVRARGTDRLIVAPLDLRD
jgi:NDP-sugar pyrophosphorylase family protein